MKKLFYSIIAIALMGCTTNAQSEMKPEDYGKFHNEILKAYIDNKGHANDFIKLYDELNIISKKNNTYAITDEESTFYKNRLTEVFGENTEINVENFKSATVDGIKKFYSEKAASVLLKFFENSESSDEVLKAFDILLNDKEISEKEKVEIEKMISVYKSSMEFWNSNTANKGGCDPWRQIFFADAVGCMFGGIGSVGYSWAVYEMQHQASSCL